MNKEKILLIGSGPLQIGQSGEFDYSGCQAIKSFKSLGYSVIVLNPNIATVQTNEDFADEVYLLPLTVESVEQILKKEKPKWVSISFGGQTALNLGKEINKLGLLSKYKCEILGTDINGVEDTEDRARFSGILSVNGIKYCQNIQVKNGFDFNYKSLFENNKSYIKRTNNTLGGLGSKIINNYEELLNEYKLNDDDFLLEENVSGWKELEFEVLRDWVGNSITVCSMENMDPMGVHTGESIVVAPIQTLDDPTFQMLRTKALEVANIFNIIGECNVQFALSPDHKDYRVIEVNARLSRSSALASKATGYPIAWVAAQLQAGKLFHEIDNPMTGKSAFYEPSMDYIVCKIPKWDFSKFNNADMTIGTSMQSVGEVMAIGKTFEEALQKAVRMLSSDGIGLIDHNAKFEDRDLEKLIKTPNSERIFAMYEWFKKNNNVIFYEMDCDVSKTPGYNHFVLTNFRGMNIISAIDSMYKMCKIDRWFLHRIQNISKLNKEKTGPKFLKQIDTTAGEYPAKSNYCYLTCNGIEHDIKYNCKDKYIIVLGSGPYKIGSSVEFDWCCVSAIQRLRQNGYKVIVLNNNPETVSTDYDECDVMVFDEINVENIKFLYDYFNVTGVLCSFAGQVPINLVRQLKSYHINVLDANALNLNITEDRSSLYCLLNDMGIKQPKVDQFIEGDYSYIGDKIKYPIILKPNFILSGDGMYYISNADEFKSVFKKVGTEYTASIIEFIEDAEEFDYDGIAYNGLIICDSVAQHIEKAGIHSGDSTIILPYKDKDITKQIQNISRRIMTKLNHSGPFNIQYMLKDKELYVVEINLRASRTLPFVSKFYKINFVHVFIDLICGKPVATHNCLHNVPDYYGIKSPMFSYHRIENADPFNIIKMNSTGETACFNNNFSDALLLSMKSVGYSTNGVKCILLSTGNLLSKQQLQDCIEYIKSNCKEIYLFGTPGTAKFHNIALLEWDQCVKYIKQNKFDLVLNIPKDYSEEELKRDYNIRRACIDNKVPLITDKNLFIDYIYSYVGKSNHQIKSLKQYVDN